MSKFNRIFMGLALMGSLSLSAQTGSDKSGMHLFQQETVTTSAVTISASENRIIVANAPVGSKLEIYSVVGIKVKEIDMKTPSGEYVVNIAKGYYIIRIGETVRKIAIR